MMTQMLLHAEKQGIIIVKVFSVAISGEIPYRNYKELGEQAVVKKVQSKNALTHSTTYITCLLLMHLYLRLR